MIAAFSICKTYNPQPTAPIIFGATIIAYGQTKGGFTITGKISRKEYGLLWNAVTEAGQVVVCDDIRIHCEIQLVKQKLSF
jgi:polyisoprenoid-binding protein YceI